MSTSDEDGRFFFQMKTGRLNWHQILNLDLQEVVTQVDVDALQSVIGNLVYSDVNEEDRAFFTNDNFVHLFRVCQLLIEYLLNVQSYLTAESDQKEESVTVFQHNAKILEKKYEAAKAQVKRSKQKNVALKAEYKNCKKALSLFESKLAEHTHKVVFECDFCSNGFTSANFLEAHISRRHGAVSSKDDRELARVQALLDEREASVRAEYEAKIAALEEELEEAKGVGGRGAVAGTRNIDFAAMYEGESDDDKLDKKEEQERKRLEAVLEAQRKEGERKLKENEQSHRLQLEQLEQQRVHELASLEKQRLMVQEKEAETYKLEVERLAREKRRRELAAEAQEEAREEEEERERRAQKRALEKKRKLEEEEELYELEKHQRRVALEAKLQLRQEEVSAEKEKEQKRRLAALKEEQRRLNLIERLEQERDARIHAPAQHPTFDDVPCVHSKYKHDAQTLLDCKRKVQRRVQLLQAQPEKEGQLLAYITRNKADVTVVHQRADALLEEHMKLLDQAAAIQEQERKKAVIIQEAERKKAAIIQEAERKVAEALGRKREAKRKADADAQQALDDARRAREKKEEQKVSAAAAKAQSESPSTREVDLSGLYAGMESDDGAEEDESAKVSSERTADDLDEYAEFLEDDTHTSITSADATFSVSEPEPEAAAETVSASVPVVDESPASWDPVEAAEPEVESAAPPTTARPSHTPSSSSFSATVSLPSAHGHRAPPPVPIITAHEEREKDLHAGTITTNPSQHHHLGLFSRDDRPPPAQLPAKVSSPTLSGSDESTSHGDHYALPPPTLPPKPARRPSSSTSHAREDQTPPPVPAHHPSYGYAAAHSGSQEDVEPPAVPTRRHR